MVVARDKQLGFVLLVAVLPVALLLLAMVTPISLVEPARLVSKPLVMLRLPVSTNVARGKPPADALAVAVLLHTAAAEERAAPVAVLRTDHRGVSS